MDSGVRAGVGQHRGGDSGHIAARHHAHPAVSRRPADVAVRPDQVLHEVEIEAVPQEREVDSGPLDVLLGREVIADQREGGVGCRTDERRVDDVPDPGRRGRVHERPMLIQTVRALRRRHHQQHLGPGQRRLRSRPVREAERQHHPALDLRRPTRVTHQQPLRNPPLGQSPGHRPADESGSSSDGDARQLAHDTPNSRAPKSFPPAQRPAWPARVSSPCCMGNWQLTQEASYADCRFLVYGGVGFPCNMGNQPSRRRRFSLTASGRRGRSSR